MPSHVPLEQRLIRSTVLDPESDCWLWVRQHTNRYGKISFWRDGRVVNKWAHRIAYEEFIGPIPSGMTVEHTCRVTLCINPAHLTLLTNEENVRRSNQNNPRRKKSAFAKT